MFVSHHTLKWTRTCRSHGRHPHAHTAHFLLNRHTQCDRAEPIRRRTLSQVDVLARHARIEDRDAFAELRRQVLRMNDAAWWIEHKNDAATTLAQDIEL